jgi:purine nucleoside permease
MRGHRVFETVLSITRHVLAGTSVLVAALSAGSSIADARPVKIMIINMFGDTPFPFSEASAFTGNLKLKESIPVRGLSPDYPDVLCNSDDVCQMVAGEGHANVAASTMALILSEKFDLRDTYFLIAGIAGIDPNQGTTGSAAWARYLIDYGLSWEIDSREIPGSAADPTTRCGPMDISQSIPPMRPCSPGTRCPVSPPLITARCIS